MRCVACCKVLSPPKGSLDAAHISRRSAVAWFKRMPWDAETIHARGREGDPTLSLATVYRALNKLEETGLVERCHLARNHRRAYYAATGKEAHDHFVCLGCRRVIEVHTPCLDQTARELSEQWGVIVTFARVYLEGYWAECAPQATLETVES